MLVISFPTSSPPILLIPLLCIVLILLKRLHVKGMIRGFDTYSVLMEVEGKQQLVYKHAISTIRF
ncbi:RNA chaperone Hfq [Bacillus sp. SS-TM]